MMNQLLLFSDGPSIEEKVQMILDRRLACKCSGHLGEDWHLIYEAIAKAEGNTPPTV